MIYGSKDTIAIECYHEPFNGNQNIFGRICFWVDGMPLGDISEPACMLDVTEGLLIDFIKRCEDLEDSELIGYSDVDLFNFLDAKLYIGDYSDGDQVVKDAIKYHKYDFLTNGGESFDNYKSFIVKQNSVFRIVFNDADDQFHAAYVEVDDLLKVVNDFLDWMHNERSKNSCNDL